MSNSIKKCFEAYDDMLAENAAVLVKLFSVQRSSENPFIFLDKIMKEGMQFDSQRQHVCTA